MLPVILRDSDFPYNSMNEVWVGNIFNDPCIRPVEHHLNMSALENWWLYIMMRGSSSFNFNMQGVWGCKQCVFCLIRFFQVSLEVVATIKKMVGTLLEDEIPPYVKIMVVGKPTGLKTGGQGLPGITRCIKCLCQKFPATFRSGIFSDQSFSGEVAPPRFELKRTSTNSFDVFVSKKNCFLQILLLHLLLSLAASDMFSSNPF